MMAGERQYQNMSGVRANCWIMPNKANAAPFTAIARSIILSDLRRVSATQIVHRVSHAVA